MLWISIWTAVLVAGGLGLLVTIQGGRFQRRVASEARELWSGEGGGPGARRSLDGLPGPVRRYLEVSGAARRAPVRSVRIRHGGTFQPAPEGKWFPIRGEQYFGIDPPGFVWWGRIRMAPGLWIEARDRSAGGQGNMLITAAATWTLADVSGPEMDQAALARFLAEMVWFPTAFLDERYLAWSSLDDTSARAVLRVGEREAGITFRFGPDGLPSSFAADRYRDVGGKGVLTPWLGECGDYREVDGLRVPFRIEVGWRVDGRDRPYARWVLERVEFDRAEPF